eukprot:6482588-Amphidinium_carterae.1
MENRKKRKEISASTRHQHHRTDQCLEETQRRQSGNTSSVIDVSDATDDSLPLSALKDVKTVEAKRTDIQEAVQIESGVSNEDISSKEEEKC